jgi:hypothetical protein
MHPCELIVFGPYNKYRSKFHALLEHVRISTSIGAQREVMIESVLEKLQRLAAQFHSEQFRAGTLKIHGDGSVDGWTDGTMAPAHAMRWEGIIGSFKVGKCADLVIVDTNLFSAWFILEEYPGLQIKRVFFRQ